LPVLLGLPPPVEPDPCQGCPIRAVPGRAYQGSPGASP